MTAKAISLTIAANGRVVIPAAMRAVLGVERGGALVARLESGALVLEPFDLAIRRAQGQVRRYAPQGVGLADELIAQRRAAAALE